MSDFIRWPIFSLLPEEFLCSIKTALVFGNSGNEAILVTHDDEVFGIGSNLSSCLGVGDQQNCLLPRKVETLCHKKLCDLSFGSGPHVLALTETGEVYAWGHNGYCQIGNGNTSQNPVFIPTILPVLQGKVITQIACGSHHSLALTSEGEVYAWGYNNCGQIGSGSMTNQSSPRKVASTLNNRKIVSVVCGQTSSLALSDTGEIFAWGYNGNGQLGVGNNTNQPCPYKVTGLGGIFMVKIACGYAHALGLSDSGLLFAWGANSYGQLGTGNKNHLVKPMEIASDKGRFIDIAASPSSHISVACIANGKLYMWGHCRGQAVTTPTETNFTKMNEVFACFSSPPLMHKPLVIEREDTRTVGKCVGEAFNDQETSDLTFMIEGKPVYVHKAVLKIRCEHFRTMFQSHWGEDEKDVIEITQFSFVVYEAFLKYLYTDKVELIPEDAIGLLDLANSYCEDQLKKLCERIIKEGITVDNAAMLMAAAIKYEAKKLEEFCFQFCVNHLTAVSQTDAFAHLDEATLKGFVQKAGQRGAFKY
ncbi:RCC1 and BTB domain-containing protein 1-like [Actinia tenebrosa]|uniref:RCC1 and BTB domain-containing protein 1-like n=1 Tax=Actinia tenebrosa TaxID=6105 RepID=A0A6P8IET3_ACTTE|nr:RCC1 and BTB domain-containing protein 1-like [Actinia tenebrosa]XP_031564712.1 RCC1 and BTB domain-containing protein 1-like [Actinia tenebrosa]XP_031564721.1 RCC1 and BTB domain-containing protein 1-like [Actinia tenebrosa]XP_031564728.1 RCC1 and BTB domain-containing protein 1-like [Actinia tenebrosa]